MLVAEFGMPFGAATYAQGQDFTCTSTYCTGANAAVKAAFVDLQNTLNNYAAMMGTTKLTVDGYIGTNTLKLAQQVANQIGAASPGTTFTAVAVNAPTFTANLKALSGSFDPSTQSALTKIQPTLTAVTSNDDSWNPISWLTTAASELVDKVASAPDLIAKNVAPSDGPGSGSTPGWVWGIAAGVGVMVVGGVGYVLLHKPKVAVVPTPKATFGKRRRKRRARR